MTTPELAASGKRRAVRATDEGYSRDPKPWSNDVATRSRVRQRQERKKAADRVDIRVPVTFKHQLAAQDASFLLSEVCGVQL